MKVVLINPPVPNILRESLPPVVEDESGTFPPLGLLYVAAYAEDVEGCSVSVLDCQGENIGHDDVASRIREIQPDVVGIQAMTFTLIDATLVAKTVRREKPNAVIVFGGPHPTIYPKETAQIPEVDVVIAGEGEYAFASLLKALIDKKPPESVRGLITKKNLNDPIIPLAFIDNLDELKMPARHLIKTENYTSPLATKNPITTMMSSRGCPAKCTFCDRPQMGKAFRRKSAKNVVDEMQYCVEELGVGEILFYDDTFTINKKRVFEVCDLIIERGLKVAWDIRARVDTVTPESIKKMKEAGCHRIHYGIESGSPRIQRSIKKYLDLEKAKEVFAMTKKEGIETLGYFMIGCPDETLDDIKMTMDYMLELKMDFAHIGVFTPYPGTQIYSEALASGFYENDYWKEFALDPTLEFMPRYWNQYFSDEELLALLYKAYGKFYARPSYIVDRVLKVRSLGEFLKKANLGVKLLKSVLLKS